MPTYRDVGALQSTPGLDVGALQTQALTAETRAAADTLSLSDLALLNYGLLVSDTGSLSDFALGNWFMSADSLGIYDAMTYSITFSGGGGGSASDILVGDTLELLDSILTSQEGYQWLNIGDVISFDDLLGSVAPYVTAAVDILPLLDSLTISQFKGYSFSDSISLLEAAQPLRSEGDTFSFLDAVGTTLADIGPTSVPWAAADSITLSDSVAFVSIPLLSLHDVISIQDEAFVKLNSNLNSYLRRYLNDVQ
jgi:hypothetical protein